MKIINQSLWAISIIALMASCKKEGCTDPTATNYSASANEDDGSCTYGSTGGTTAQPEPYTPNYSGEFAALVAIKTVTTTSTPIGNIDTELGTAVAVFSNGTGSAVTAGTVNCDGNGLTLQSNNSYVYTPGSGNPTGISFVGSVLWDGSGATWPAFSGQTNQSFSAISPITSGNVSANAAYNLSSDNVTNADSILFAVYGPNGSVQHIVAGGVTSYTFTAAEMGSVGTGSGFVQIIGLKYDPQTIATKPYWFINETVRTKTVNIQ